MTRSESNSSFFFSRNEKESKFSGFISVSISICISQQHKIYIKNSHLLTENKNENKKTDLKIITIEENCLQQCCYCKEPKENQQFCDQAPVW